MARTDPQLNIRCPQELRDKLEQAANNKKRSLTSEVVSRLEESFEPSLPPSFGLEQMEFLTKMAGANYLLVLQKHLDKLSDDEALKAVRSLIKEVSEEYKHLTGNTGGK